MKLLSFHLHAMPQGWWGSPSQCCLVAPAQSLGGQYHPWPQGGVGTAPVSVTAALWDVLEKHSEPGTTQAEHEENNNGKKDQSECNLYCIMYIYVWNNSNPSYNEVNQRKILRFCVKVCACVCSYPTCEQRASACSSCPPSMRPVTACCNTQPSRVWTRGRSISSTLCTAIQKGVSYTLKIVTP